MTMEAKKAAVSIWVGNIIIFHLQVLSLEFEDDDDLLLLDETVSQSYFRESVIIFNISVLFVVSFKNKL